MKRKQEFCERMKCSKLVKDVCGLGCAEHEGCDKIEDLIHGYNKTDPCSTCKANLSVPKSCLYALERIVMKKGKK